MQGQGVFLSPQFSRLSLEGPSTLVSTSPDPLCVPQLPRGVILLMQEAWGRTHLPEPGPMGPETALEESPCEIIFQRTLRSSRPGLGP